MITNEDILEEFHKNNLKYDRVSWSEDGDIAYYFFIESKDFLLKKYASITFNDEQDNNCVVLLKVMRPAEAQAIAYNNLSECVKDLMGFIKNTLTVTSKLAPYLVNK
jgi:hypothetical protein